jgi:hypothetical protein
MPKIPSIIVYAIQMFPNLNKIKKKTQEIYYNQYKDFAIQSF